MGETIIKGDHGLVIRVPDEMKDKVKIRKEEGHQIIQIEIKTEIWEEEI